MVKFIETRRKAIAGAIVSGLASTLTAAPTASWWSILIGAVVAGATYLGVYAAPKNAEPR